MLRSVRLRRLPENVRLRQHFPDVRVVLRVAVGQRVRVAVAVADAQRVRCRDDELVAFGSNADADGDKESSDTLFSATAAATMIILIFRSGNIIMFTFL